MLTQEQDFKMTKCQQSKKEFVKYHLLPLIISLGYGISNVEYTTNATRGETGFYQGLNDMKDPISGEWVVLTFVNGYKKGVCVSGDSHLAICRDVLKTF